MFTNFHFWLYEIQAQQSIPWKTVVPVSLTVRYGDATEVLEMRGGLDEWDVR
jgi:hypothetical protein